MRKTLGGNIHDAITKAGYVLGVVALLLILVMLCTEIVSRYFFRSPTQWISDFCSYALVFSTCLITPNITRTNGHIAITYIRDSLREDRRIWLDTAIFLLAAAACWWAGWYAVQEALRQYDRNIHTIAVVSMPRWCMSAAIAYALISSGLYFVRQCIGQFVNQSAQTSNPVAAEQN